MKGKNYVQVLTVKLIIKCRVLNNHCDYYIFNRLIDSYINVLTGRISLFKPFTAYCTVYAFDK